MTQEEKARAYDKVRKKIAIRFGSNVADEIFSEFEMSENERIRKEMIEILKKEAHDFPSSVIAEKSNSWLAWLEEQGEHANFRNKIQVGDKVTRNKDGVLVNLSQLKRVAKKQGKNNMGISEATKQKLEGSLNKALEKETPESCNEFLDKQGEQKFAVEMKSAEESLGIDSDTYNKIVDECIYGEQKPAWSEEDKEMSRFIGNAITADGASEYLESKAIQVIDAHVWLDGLKDRVQPQPKQEWSEEDEKMIQDIINDIAIAQEQVYCKSRCEDEINWLKSIKERCTWKPSDELDEASYQIGIKRVLENPESYGLTKHNWKPSDEQINTLWDAIVYVEGCNSNFKGSGSVLENLYNDLKKLK